MLYGCSQQMQAQTAPVKEPDPKDPMQSRYSRLQDMVLKYSPGPWFGLLTTHPQRLAKIGEQVQARWAQLLKHDRTAAAAAAARRRQLLSDSLTRVAVVIAS